jgi:hypothetical protein
MTVFWDVVACSLLELYKFYVSEVLFVSIIRASIIALMMEAERTSETLVSFYRTIWRNTPENSHLHTRRRENLKSHQHL